MGIENKEKHLQTSRDWKRINRPYINDYKKWRRGTLKKKPKLENYRWIKIGDRYYFKHNKNNPKLTPEQIKNRRMKRNKDKRKKRGY